MGSKQYIIPADLMTVTDMKSYRVAALAAGIKRCKDRNIGDPNPAWDNLSIAQMIPKLSALEWPAHLDQLEFQPILHAGAALDQWNTPVLAAVGTAYSLFQAIAAPAAGLRISKLVVFYGVTIETIPLPISRLIFRRNNAAGLITTEFDLEPLAVMQRLMGFFSEPVIWDDNTAYAAQGLCRIAGGVARVQLMNFVFEPAGTTHQ